MHEPTPNSISSPETHSPVTVFSLMTVLLTGVCLVVALWLAWLTKIILLLLFAAMVVATLITAVVEWLCERFKLRRRLAFSLVLCVAGGLVGLLGWLIGPSIVAQFGDLQTDLPTAAHQLMGRVNGYGWGRWLILQWSGYSQLSSNISSALTRIGGIVLTTATVLSGIVLVGFLGIYLAAEPEVYFSYLQRVAPFACRVKLNACASAAVGNLRWWILSQVLSMTAVGIIVAAGLWMLGVPLAGTLGMIAALLTFIPNIGPMLSVVPAALLAVAISPMRGLLTVLLFLAVHFLEGNIITPLLERRIVRLPPALTMAAQLLFAVIAGPLGVALAAPFTAAALGVFDVLVPVEAVVTTEVLPCK